MYYPGNISSSLLGIDESISLRERHPTEQCNVVADWLGRENLVADYKEIHVIGCLKIMRADSKCGSLKVQGL